jgi:hypothetical protein
MSADVGRFPGEVLAAEYRAARERPSRLWGLTYDTVVHEHDLVVGEGEVQLELATEPFESCVRPRSWVISIATCPASCTWTCRRRR